ncbi:MFS transporter [Marinospirillum perlucidum]|uniref:MFS transporter n=1 Tax=Marinospirillum perlucidum TaxID=1982602 RepID=UPI000DF4C76E|nr:MFS transporter [Marinospirillum perlucidum]
MKKIKLVLLLASSLTVMAGAIITPGLSDLGAYFASYPDVWVKLIITLPALFIALFSPLMGWLADRFGRLPVLFSCLLIYALGGAAGSLAENMTWMLTTRALLGIGVAGIMGLATTLIGDYFSGQERQSFMGLQGSFMALGGVVFVNLGGLLALWSWRANFLIYLFSLVVLLLAWLYLREPGQSEDQEAGEQETSGGFPLARVLPVYCLGFVAMALFYLLPAQMPFLLAERFAANSLETAWVIAVSTLSGAVAGFLFGRIKNLISHALIYALALVLFGVGYWLVAEVASYPLLLLAVLMSGFGAGLTFPAGNHWLLTLAPLAYRGRVMGGFSSVFFMGQFLSPLLAAPVEAYSGLEGVFRTAAWLALGLALLLLLQVFFRRSADEVG